MCPSLSILAAWKAGTINRLPQFPVMLFLDPSPDQKKYAGLVLGIASSSLAISGGNGTVTLVPVLVRCVMTRYMPFARSEEHTSELQSLRHLVCRLLLEK